MTTDTLNDNEALDSGSFRPIMYQQSQDRIILCREGEIAPEHNKFRLSEYLLKSEGYNVMVWSETDWMLDYGIVSSLDERYIVCFGGRRDIDGDGELTDQIKVFDLQTETVSESDIKCPISSNYRAALMGSKMQDELAVYGFVNQSFKSPEMRDVQVLPIHIIQLLSNWYRNERVYLISMSSEEKDHWMMNMDAIIGSEDGKSK